MARRLIVVSAALLLLGSPPAAGARRPRCKLTGPNLAHSRVIKVVKRMRDEETQLLGCVKPNGRVRTLATGLEAFTRSDTFSVVDVAGTWILVRFGSSSQYGTSESLAAIDVRTAKRYTIASREETSGSTGQGQAVAAFAVNVRGYTAALVDDLVFPSDAPPSATQRRVVLFDPRGAARSLDSGAPADIDPAALILDHHTVLWAHGGLTRYARF